MNDVAVVFSGLTLLAFFLFLIWKDNTQVVPAAPHIPLESICPACGHSGCSLRFVPPGQVEVGDKGKLQSTAPMVERKCNTCGALAYEKTVLDPEKWIAK